MEKIGGRTWRELMESGRLTSELCEKNRKRRCFKLQSGDGKSLKSLFARCKTRRAVSSLKVAGRLVRQLSERTSSDRRSEEHMSELQSLMRISYAVFCLKKKKQKHHVEKNRQENDKNNRT